VVIAGRRGRSTLGCLFILLIVVAIGYFGVNVGEVYLRYYRFRDSMQQTVRFANRLSDDAIRARLSLSADSLGLPESAHRVQIRRRDNWVQLRTDYYDRVELPLFAREIRFQPQAEASF
jgi:hypothetical protein